MASAHFHLFTYGTLKEKGSEAATRMLAGCERVGTGQVRGVLYDLGAFPALLLDGPDAVDGVIWRCPTDRLSGLDEYEGVGEGLFRRAAVRVGEIPCWIYVAGPKLGPRLVPDARVKPQRQEE
jgi:gamma-glutamylcyclotransferase (GGCT)/AIG2-like uncharacterized protein YtfP